MGFHASNNGTMTIQYNFLNTVTYDTIPSPTPYPDTATVVANLDYTHITVTTSECTLVGDYTETSATGTQKYAVDLSMSSCSLTAGGEAIRMTDTSGRIEWSADKLWFYFSGDGAITDSTSIVLIEFDRL